MQRSMALVWSLLTLVPAGCSTSAPQILLAYAAPIVPVTPRCRPAEPDTVPKVVRAAGPESPASPVCPVGPQPATYPKISAPAVAVVGDSQSGVAPVVPAEPARGVIQACPLKPVVEVLAGSCDPQVREDALSTMAMIAATGSVSALHHASGNSSTSRGMHRVSGDVDGLMQTDDDQSAVSKQRRPPFFFTLEWKY